MKRGNTVLALATLAALGLAACVTINVYFPEAAIRDMSQAIEEEVQKQAAEAGAIPPLDEAPPAGEPAQPAAPPPATSSLLRDLLGGTSALAAEEVPDPGISSPAIRQIIGSRAARVPAIRKYKAAGAIGESNQALLALRDLEALADLKARAEVQRLVKAENADREQLFREMAAAKQVDPGQIPKIRETYAETLRANARPGDWIQMPDGAWKRK